jgi:predicted kinase
MFRKLVEKWFLNEDDKIADILKEESIFVLVIGGSASGKNYIFEKNFKNIELIDNDQITKELSGGDFEKARKLISKATAIANKRLEKAFQEHRSVGQVSTGSNQKGVENKLIKAKSYAMKTALILIDADVKKAIKRNKERAQAGKQGLIPEWKVQKTNENARETYNNLKKLDVVDYKLVIKN